MTVLSMELDDFIWYVDQALRSLSSILTELGDDRATERPDLPGANSPYAIVSHCLGVTEQWGGESIAGRPVERDRPAEFVATGRVDDLLGRVAAAREQLARDLGLMDPLAAPRHPPDPEDVDIPLGRSQAGVAMHIYEELSQHLGQLELTRDVLLSR